MCFYPELSICSSPVFIQLTPGWKHSSRTLTSALPDRLNYPKNLRRIVLVSGQELDDIVAWQTQHTFSKSVTFQYDKILYLVEHTEENSHIAVEKILAFDYPDGTLVFRHCRHQRPRVPDVP